jgi:hypothetical protein
MASYACFDELEASVPLSQLRPSVAFSRCAAHLPPDVDQLRGDELIMSLENTKKSPVQHEKSVTKVETKTRQVREANVRWGEPMLGGGELLRWIRAPFSG